MSTKKIVCLVGPSGAGKSTIANLLTEVQNVRYISLSTKVREYVAQLGIKSPTRADLQIHANSLRREKGNGIFAQMVVDSLVNDNTCGVMLVDGVRHPNEIEILKSSEISTFVLGVTSDQRRRFERVLQRQRPSDPKTWEEFLECDRRENGEEGQEHQQENAKCLEMADFTIINDGKLSELYSQLVDFVEKVHEGKLIQELKQKVQ